MEECLTGDGVGQSVCNLRIQFGERPPEIVVAQPRDAIEDGGRDRWRKERKRSRPSLSRNSPVYSNLCADAARKVLQAQEFWTPPFPELNHHGLAIYGVFDNLRCIIWPLKSGKTRQATAHLLPRLRSLVVGVSGGIRIAESGC